MGDSTNRLLVFAPKNVEHEVLRICQTQLVEHPLVGTLDSYASGIDCVAELIVKRRWVVMRLVILSSCLLTNSKKYRKKQYRDK